jgi:putative tryptophan/tyrosine transport system substrate-binding protein
VSSDKWIETGKNMKRKITVVALCAMLFALCSSAEAQQPKKIPRIGYLSALDLTGESTRAEAIRAALRELGYLEGQNIAIEYRYAAEKRDRLPELAAELVRLKVDIIMVAGGATLIRPAKNATKTIPIVMTGAGTDPVEEGLVESLARPGGNITGLTNIGGQLGGQAAGAAQGRRSQSCSCRGSLRTGQFSECT